MEQTILWFLGRIVELTEKVLSWKILGNFSLLHFILGFNFLIILFTFFKFGIETGGESAVIGVNNYRNTENKRQRQEYKESYEYYKEKRSRNENYDYRYRKESRYK